MASKSFIKAAQKFIKAYAWVLRDHIPSNKHKLISILVLSVVGALAQGVSIAFIAFAVNYMENQTLTGIPVLDRILGSQMTLILIFAICLLALVLTGAKAAYAAMVKARALARSYHLKCAKRCLSILSRYTVIDHPGLPQNEGEFRRLLLRDSIHLGNSMEIMLKMLEPFLRSAVAIVILFWINWQLSIITVPLFVVFVPGIYGVTSSIQRDSNRFFEATLVGMFKNVSSIVGAANVQNLQYASGKHISIEEMYEANPAVQEYFDQYDRIQLANGRVQLTVAGLSSVLIVWVLLAGGYFATVSLLSWGLVLAYLMAVTQVLASIRMIMSFITSLSIFYPAVYRYQNLCESAPRDDSGPSSDRILTFSSHPITIKSDEVLPGGKGSVELIPGKPRFYLNDYSVNRFTLKDVLEPLAVSASLDCSELARQTCFIGPKAILPPGSIRRTLIGDDPNGEREKEIWRYLDLMGLHGEIQELDAGLDTMVDPALWQGLSYSLKMALVVMPVLFDIRQIILLDMWVMHWAEEKPKKAMLELLKEKILLLVANGLSIPITLADSVIIVQNGRISGIGSLQWFEKIKPDVKNIGQPAVAADSDTMAELGA